MTKILSVKSELGHGDYHVDKVRLSSESPEVWRLSVSLVAGNEFSEIELEHASVLLNRSNLRRLRDLIDQVLFQ